MTDDASSRYRVPALEKGLDILELLAGQSRGMSLTAITAQLGRSMGEIYRIVVALEERGYIHREADGESYALSLRLFELATEHPPTNRLLSVALPAMQSLAEQSRQSCHLGIVSNGMLLVVAQVNSPNPMHYGVRLGARFPVLETSSGAVILAFLQRTEALASAMTQSPEHAASAMARMAKIRVEGGERLPSLAVDGVINISRPVFDHHGVIGALTVPFLRQRNLAVGADEAESALIAAAQKITIALGGHIRSVVTLQESSS